MRLCTADDFAAAAPAFLAAGNDFSYCHPDGCMLDVDATNPTTLGCWVYSDGQVRCDDDIDVDPDPRGDGFCCSDTTAVSEDAQNFVSRFVHQAHPQAAARLICKYPLQPSTTYY